MYLNGRATELRKVLEREVGEARGGVEYVAEEGAREGTHAAAARALYECTHDEGARPPGDGCEWGGG